MGFKRLRRTLYFIHAIAIIALLSGCLYPDELRSENRRSGIEYVAIVQSAIDQYYGNTSVLPIKNSTMDTPIYEKYIIDFGRLLESPFLSEAPPNAFEKGGNDQYVLVNVEQRPEVKLLDLVTAQEVNEVQRAITNYKSSHQGKVPVGESMSAGWHTIDYDRLGISDVQVRSVYSGRYLSLLVNSKGEVIVDYGPDLMTLILDKSITPTADQDLRSLLTEHSVYVPVKSVSYYWRNNEPSIAAG